VLGSSAYLNLEPASKKKIYVYFLFFIHGFQNQKIGSKPSLEILKNSQNPFLPLAKVLKISNNL